jgi:hypothetical protein
MSPPMVKVRGLLGNRGSAAFTTLGLASSFLDLDLVFFFAGAWTSKDREKLTVSDRDRERDYREITTEMKRRTMVINSCERRKW